MDDRASRCVAPLLGAVVPRGPVTVLSLEFPASHRIMKRWARRTSIPRGFVKPLGDAGKSSLARPAVSSRPTSLTHKDHQRVLPVLPLAFSRRFGRSVAAGSACGRFGRRTTARNRRPSSIFTSRTSTARMSTWPATRASVLLIVNTASQCGFTPSIRRWRRSTRNTRTKASRSWPSRPTSLASRSPGATSRSRSSARPSTRSASRSSRRSSSRARGSIRSTSILTSDTTNPQVQRQDPLELYQVPGQPKGRGDRPLPAQGQTHLRQRHPRPSKRPWLKKVSRSLAFASS